MTEYEELEKNINRVNKLVRNNDLGVQRFKGQSLEPWRYCIAILGI